jgi:DNA-binding FadR family transcriptional regulator
MALLHPTDLDKARRTNHAVRMTRVGGAGAAARQTSTSVFDEGRVGRHVRVPKTAELVAAHLRRQIVRGELVEGDALPPEAVLMEQFGVSRPTLREAFRVLESEALISVRRGAHGGARVHTPDGHVAARYAGLVLEHRGTTIADVAHAHALLEPPAVRMIAAASTDLVRGRLQSALDEADRALATSAEDGGGKDGSAQDPRTSLGGFHHLLIELAGNQTLSMIDNMLQHILDAATGRHLPPAEHRAATPSAAADRAAQSEHQEVHRQVVELIGRGDADGAEALWRDHLQDSDEPGPTTVLDLLGE